VPGQDRKNGIVRTPVHRGAIRPAFSNPMGITTCQRKSVDKIITDFAADAKREGS